MPSNDPPAAAEGTVFFLSDYGTRDEFVGVVHAVLRSGAPGTPVIDLTHRIPPFDVRSGAHALVRAVPHLGPGVVLAVVDPGVGSDRRGLCLQCEPDHGGPAFFVGPDNGLLVAAAELLGGGSIARAFALDRAGVPDRHRGTFDGRDLFAPAAAALSTGRRPEEFGEPIETDSVARLPPGVVEHGRQADGRTCLRSEVLWVDHFGNVQLAATRADAHRSRPCLLDAVDVTAVVERDLAPDGITLRCVGAFAELEHGQLGLLVDANDHLAVVAGEASAGHWLNVVAGELVVLTW